MLDGILLERSGLPAAVVCTEPFIASGKAMARHQGIQDYAFAVIPHPINVASDADLQSWAEAAAPQVAALLLERPG